MIYKKFDLLKNFFYNIIVKSYTGFICLLLIYSQANIENFWRKEMFNWSLYELNIAPEAIVDSHVSYTQKFNGGMELFSKRMIIPI